MSPGGGEPILDDSAPDYSAITYDVDDGILTITLNRPDALNAFTEAMASELAGALGRADADDDVRVVIVTGAGRAFCAGADLSTGGGTFDAKHRGMAEDEVRRDGGGTVTIRAFESLKPIIAAINGPAVGVGITMTLAMDIRLASESARFGFVFARRGIVPEAVSSWFLPRVVGISQAAEWLYTGRVFPAAEALAGGLVRSLHEPDELMPAATALAREIADNTSAVSVALGRRLMMRGLTFDSPYESHLADSRAMSAVGRSADAYEGIASFLEKRPASFPDKVSAGLPPIFDGPLPSWYADLTR